MIGLTNRFSKFTLFRAFFILVVSLLFSMTHAAVSKEKWSVVTSFSILQSLIQDIGGDDVIVSTVVPLNADPHIYQPTPNDAKNLARADLVIVNGLGFEGWIDRLIQASGYEGDIIVASNGVKPRSLPGNTTLPDPHAWHDIRNAVLYIQNITQALCILDPSKKENFESRSKKLISTLEQLHSQLLVKFSLLSKDNRKVVTTHDAFWYFGEAYGLIFLSPIGISTEAQPSASQVARLIQQIRDENIRAVFLENLTNPRLIQQIVNETNISVQGTLYADSLSDLNGPASSYREMINHNAELIIQALMS